MRHFITVIFILLLCTLTSPTLQAQEKSFIEHINMPIEIGLASSLGDFDSGLYFRTCLEYRAYKNCGWFVSLEYDEYDLGYHDRHFEGSNATEGTFSVLNYFLGGGYRFAFTTDENRRDETGVFSIGAMLQPGMSFASVENVTGTGTDYRLKTVETCNFAIKASLQLDYLFSEYFGIYIAESFTQPFGHQLMPGHDAGVLSTSIGITSFF